MLVGRENKSSCCAGWSWVEVATSSSAPSASEEYAAFPVSASTLPECALACDGNRKQACDSVQGSKQTGDTTNLITSRRRRRSRPVPTVSPPRPTPTPRRGVRQRPLCSRLCARADQRKHRPRSTPSRGGLGSLPGTALRRAWSPGTAESPRRLLSSYTAFEEGWAWATARWSGLILPTGKRFRWLKSARPDRRLRWQKARSYQNSSFGFRKRYKLCQVHSVLI